MRLFRFSQEAAAVMSDIRKYARELDLEVDKAFEILVKERTALKKIDYIKGLADYESEWKRIVESLEYMKTLASLTASGNAEQWTEALQKGIVRTNMSAGLEGMWTADDAKIGEHKRGRPGVTAPDSRAPDAGASDVGAPDAGTSDAGVPKPFEYQLNDVRQAVYLLREMLKKIGEEFPDSVNLLDNDWKAAIVGFKIISEVLKSAREEAAKTKEPVEGLLTRGRLDKMLPEIKMSADRYLDALPRVLGHLTPMERKKIWDEAESMQDDATKLIFDVERENRSRGAPVNSAWLAGFRKYAAAPVDPRTEDPQTQLGEVYDDFLAIKEGERLNKAFSVATSRIQKIITHLYQQADKLYKLVTSPEDKEGVKMVFSGMKWMAKIGKMLQMRGRDGAQEWATAKRNGLDQLEIAGIEEKDVDVDNPPLEPPKPDQPKPDVPGSPDKPGPGPGEPQSVGPGPGEPKSVGPGPEPLVPVEDSGAQWIEQMLNSFRSISGDADAVAQEIVSNVGGATGIKEMAMQYFAGLVYEGNVVLQTQMERISDPELPAAKEALGAFDYAFRRSIAATLERLDPSGVEYRKMFDYVSGGQRSRIADDGLKMANILKQRLEYGPINSEMPGAGEQLKLPAAQRVLEKMNDQDIRVAVNNMTREELTVFLQNLVPLMMSAKFISAQEAMNEIMKNLGLGSAIATPQQQEAVGQALQRAVESVLNKLLIPTNKVPKNILGMLVDALGHVGIERIMDPGSSAEVVDRFMNDFKETLLSAKAKETQAKASYKIKRLGLKKKPKDADR